MFNSQNWEKNFETKKQGMRESIEMIIQSGLGVYIGLENAKNEGKYSKYRISIFFVSLENMQTKI